MKTKDESYLFYGPTSIELTLAKYFNKYIHPKTNERSKTILIVGGSTVWCDGLPRSLAWPKQLENMLYRRGYRNISVYNLGEGGSNSTKDVDRLRSYLKTNGAPFMVIFYTGVNDSASMLAVRTQRSYVLASEIHANFLTRLDAFLMKRSLFYTTLREKIAKIFLKNIDSVYITEKLTPEEKKRLELIDGIGIEILKKNLLEVFNISRKLRIRLVFGSPPVGISASEKYRTSYDKLREMMERVSKKYNIPYIDTMAHFDTMEDRDLLFFPDRVHVNKRGAVREAEVVYNYLTSHRLLD